MTKFAMLYRFTIEPTTVGTVHFLRGMGWLSVGKSGLVERVPSWIVEDGFCRGWFSNSNLLLEISRIELGLYRE